MNNKQKTRTITIAYLLFVHLAAWTQTENSQAITTMTIEECYEWAKVNFQFTKQIDIIDKTNAFNINNASHGNLPQLSMTAQASYQSEVTKFPVELPGVQIQTIDKDQYKVYVEAYQPLSNFSIVKTQQKVIDNNSNIEEQKLELEFFKLKDRINQIFFGTLLIDEKIKQLKIIKSDVDSTILIIQAHIDNGTATITDKQLLNVERISLIQQIDENIYNQKAFINMLATLTGKNISVKTALIRPTNQTINNTINRPEMKLFSLQNQAINLKHKQLDQSLKPNIGLFGQGGYGRPALNFLSNEFRPYFIAGINFKWNISNFYNLKNTKNSLSLATENIAAKQKAFLLSTRLTQSQQTSEIEKYQGLINSDKKIIDIRQNILNTVKVQLENGLITTIDYIKNLNNLDKAKQTLLLHETQLLLAKQNFKNTTGN